MNGFSTSITIGLWPNILTGSAWLVSEHADGCWHKPRALGPFWHPAGGWHSTVEQTGAAAAGCRLRRVHSRRASASLVQIYPVHYGLPALLLIAKTWSDMYSGIAALVINSAPYMARSSARVSNLSPAARSKARRPRTYLRTSGSRHIVLPQLRQHASPAHRADGGPHQGHIAAIDHYGFRVHERGHSA